MSRYRISAILMGLALLIPTFILHAKESIEITCSPSEHCKNYSLGIGGECLYWTISQSELDYAVDINSAANPDEIVGPGKMHFLDYSLEKGYRVWGRVEVCKCCVDAACIYTHYSNDSRVATSWIENSTHLLATLLHPNTQRCQALHAWLENDLKYQTLDALIGHHIFSYCNRLDSHLFIGARMMKLDQKLKVNYEEMDFLNDPTVVKLDSNLKGAGLHAGADFTFPLFKGFGLQSSFSGSLLVGRTDEKHLQQIVNTQGDVVTTEINVNEKQYTVIHGYHLSSGINWSNRFKCGLNVLFNVVYEINDWFSVPSLRRYSGGDCPGSNNGSTKSHLGFHGLTGGLTVSY